MKKQIQHIKKHFNIYKKSMVFIIIISIFIFSYSKATKWCNYQDFFSMDTAFIHGNNLVSSEHIIKTGNIHKHMNILTTDCNSIRNNIETHPYVKAAIVSKRYPNKMDILIKERTPLAYLNTGTLYLIDREGIVLPIPDAIIRNQLPVITIVDDSSCEVIPGKKLNSPEIQEITQLVINTYSISRPLFNTISEIRYDVITKELILFNKDNANPIYIGSENFNKKMIILSKFQKLLTGKKRLRDYKYIDLRWNRQVIAKEI